jgi:hypothetical protein
VGAEKEHSSSFASRSSSSLSSSELERREEDSEAI